MRICETLEDFGRGFVRIHEAGRGFVKINETLGEDLPGFMRICKDL